MSVRTTIAAALLATAMALPGRVSADTLIVSAAGPLRSVAEAVRQAPAGSRIVVRPGRYRETPFVVDRTLTIVGEGRPVLEAAAAGTLIRVVADDVTVSGLVLAGIAPSYV